MGDAAPLGRWKKTTVQEVADAMDEYARTHTGSRLVQQKIETANDEEKEILVNAVLPELPRHASSVFGNYIVQRLLECVGTEHLTRLFGSMQGHIAALSRDPYGCRVVQKALEICSRSPDRNLMAMILEEVRQGNPLHLIKDQNGNHVMQKVLELLPLNDVAFIPQTMRGHMQTISVHLYGCRVAQRLFERAPLDELDPLFDELFPAFCELAQDQFGNYVLQHVAEFGSEEHRRKAVDLVCENLATMACHKFASNVVEKVLSFTTIDGLNRVLDSALAKGKGSGGYQEPPLLRMMRDRYGNYVVQKLLDTATGERRENLLDLLRDQASVLRKFSYGKHILSRIER